MRLQEYGPTAPGGIVRLVIGMGSGLTSGLVFGALMTWQHLLAPHDTYGWVVFAAYATVTDALLGTVVGRRPYGPAVSASGGLLLGLLGWVLWWLTVDPLLRGTALTWSIAAATTAYPELVGSLLQGALAGMLFHLAVTRLNERPGGRPAEPRVPHVVIVGGGFGGVSAARRFERLSLRGHRVEVTLISDSNFLL